MIVEYQIALTKLSSQNNELRKDCIMPVVKTRQRKDLER